jgi:hypothetical protein
VSTKAQTINNAFTQLRISGLTVIPSPSDVVLGLYLLETMMAEYFGQWNLAINYNFEETPSVNSQTGVELAYQSMMDLNLAIRLIPAFDKQVPQTLVNLASVALSKAIGRVSSENMRMIQPSRRMPLGSGNTFRGVFWNRYAIPVPVPPVSASTNYILQGETLNYFEDFSAFLGTATIASYTIEADQLLTIVTSANADPRITYTITAPTQPPATYGPYQIVQITITDSLGRVEIRLINFGVATPPTVGS